MPNFLSVPEYYTTSGAYVSAQFDVFETGTTEVALGNNANAEGNHTVTIGAEASAPNDSGVSIGYRANVRDDYGISIGANSGSEGLHSVSIGANAIAQAPDGGPAIQIGANAVTYSSINFGNKSLIDLVYPVGSIYMSVNNTNPTSLFGGTWVAWGSGRVPIGVNTSDSDFNAVENRWRKVNYVHSFNINYHDRGRHRRVPCGVVCIGKPIHCFCPSALYHLLYVEKNRVRRDPA